LPLTFPIGAAGGMRPPPPPVLVLARLRGEEICEGRLRLARLLHARVSRSTKVDDIVPTGSGVLQRERHTLLTCSSMYFEEYRWGRGYK